MGVEGPTGPTGPTGTASAIYVTAISITSKTFNTDNTIIPMDLIIDVSTISGSSDFTLTGDGELMANLSGYFLASYSITYIVSNPGNWGAAVSIDSILPPPCRPSPPEPQYLVSVGAVRYTVSMQAIIQVIKGETVGLRFFNTGSSGSITTQSINVPSGSATTTCDLTLTLSEEYLIMKKVLFTLILGANIVTANIPDTLLRLNEARGPQGPRGPRGPQGYTGDQGQRGGPATMGKTA